MREHWKMRQRRELSFGNVLFLHKAEPLSQTIWGVSDDHSWIPNGAVLPFDAQKQPKPAFFAIADAFDHKPQP